MIKLEIRNVFTGKRTPNDFVEIFSFVMHKKTINDFCAEVIKEELIDYNGVDATVIIKQLNETNCTYLFTYMVIYYSIYRFRFEWEYLNIKVLKFLWKKHGSMKADEKEVIEKMNNSNINHRFEKEMYIKLMEYIDTSIYDGLINVVYRDNILDVFYIWVIKTCIITENDSVTYLPWHKCFDLDTQIIIINELSKHDELMERNSVFNWIRYMRRNIFVNKKNFPYKLNITLRTLLLVDIDPEVVVEYMINNPYNCCRDDIGMYLLIKIENLSHEMKQKKLSKEIIKRAFITKNMGIDEYIDTIAKECHTCRNEINYITKEKMKAYLILNYS